MDNSFSTTALLVTLFCKQICDYLLEETLAEEEVKAFLGKYYDTLSESIMSKEADSFIQHFVLANQGPQLAVAINQFMAHVTKLMTQMASNGLDIKKTIGYNLAEGEEDEKQD